MGNSAGAPKNQLPAHFLEPTEDVLALISEFLDRLPINPEPDVMKSRPDEDPVVGTKAEVLAAVASELDQHHAEHLAEVGEVPWTFDYVIDDFEDDETAVRGLAVLSRLIPQDPAQGMTLFGPTVFRVGADRFLCWVE